MSPLLTKEPPDITEGCQGTLPSREKTQGQPSTRTWLQEGGQGHTTGGDKKGGTAP
ncbi:hypothetical protein P7K49_030368, partial [Saguinus oedipus]